MQSMNPTEARHHTSEPAAAKRAVTRPELLTRIAALEPAQVASAVYRAGIGNPAQALEYTRLFEESLDQISPPTVAAVTTALNGLIDLDARCSAANTIHRFIAGAEAHEQAALRLLARQEVFHELILFADTDAVPLEGGMVKTMLQGITPQGLAGVLERLSFAVHLENGIGFQQLRLINQDGQWFLGATESTLSALAMTRDSEALIRARFSEALDNGGFRSQYVQPDVPIMVITHGRRSSITCVEELIANLARFGHIGGGKPAPDIFLLNDLPGAWDPALRGEMQRIAASEPGVRLHFVGEDERRICIERARATIAADGGEAERAQMLAESMIGSASGGGGNRTLAALLAGGRNYIVVDDDISPKVPVLIQSTGQPVNVEVDLYSGCQRSIARSGVICSGYQYVGHVDTATENHFCRYLLFDGHESAEKSRQIAYGSTEDAGIYSRKYRVIYDEQALCYIQGGVMSFPAARRGLVSRLPSLPGDRNDDYFINVIPALLHFPYVAKVQEALSEHCRCLYAPGAVNHLRADGGRAGGAGKLMIKEELSPFFEAIVQLVIVDQLKAGLYKGSDFTESNMSEALPKIGEALLKIVNGPEEDSIALFRKLSQSFMHSRLGHICYLCTSAESLLQQSESRAPDSWLEPRRAAVAELRQAIESTFGIKPESFDASGSGYPDRYRGGGFPPGIEEQLAVRFRALFDPLLRSYGALLRHWPAMTAQFSFENLGRVS